MYSSRTDELAKLILETIPPAMAQLRGEMRAHCPPELSVPQFRILGQVFRGTVFVGEIARMHGVSQPAMSKMVDLLVKRGFLLRRIPQTQADRRQIPLELTPKAEKMYKDIRKKVKDQVSVRLKNLSASERQTIWKGLEGLETALGSKRK